MWFESRYAQEHFGRNQEQSISHKNCLGFQLILNCHSFFCIISPQKMYAKISIALEMKVSKASVRHWSQTLHYRTFLCVCASFFFFLWPFLKRKTFQKEFCQFADIGGKMIIKMMKNNYNIVKILYGLSPFQTLNVFFLFLSLFLFQQVTLTIEISNLMTLKSGILNSRKL